MKSVTEFPQFKLAQGLKAKAALSQEGKSAEEIQQSLGETFKYEGEKLKYFFNALEVAEKNPDKLARVLIISLNEGESAPPKAVKIEEMHYVPDFQVEARKPVLEKVVRGGNTKKGGKGQGAGRPKESPWGAIPESKDAKKANKAAPKAE